MTSFTKITIDTTIAQPLPTVWTLFTQPEHIIQWNFASDDWHCPRASNDLRVGGKYSVRMEAKDGSFGFDLVAVYSEIVPHKRLVYSLEDGRIVATTFEPVGNGTKVTTVFDAEKVHPEEMQRSGWQAILNNFKGHAERHMATPSRNIICLWFDGGAEEAAQFYARTFPDSSVGAVFRAPSDYPSGTKGDVLTIEFTVLGIPCVGLNGGPAFKHSEAFSFQVTTVDQAQTDRYWNAIVDNGGQGGDCGWCKDRWGLSWQITPVALLQALRDPDSEAARRSFEAMMQMQKIDIATIERARKGVFPDGSRG